MACQKRGGYRKDFQQTARKTADRLYRHVPYSQCRQQTMEIHRKIQCPRFPHKEKRRRQDPPYRVFVQ